MIIYEINNISFSLNNVNIMNEDFILELKVFQMFHAHSQVHSNKLRYGQFKLFQYFITVYNTGDECFLGPGPNFYNRRFQNCSRAQNKKSIS